MKTDGIIFDLDGTLWNATEAICITWSQILENYPDVDTEITVERLEGCMGLLLSDIAKRLFPLESKERQKELMDKCCEREVEYLRENGGKLYDGTEEMLKALSERYDLYIVSNCQDGYIESFLDGHKFHRYFKDFTCPGKTGKPKGDNIRIIAEKHNIKYPVYVGDTQGDAESAEKAEVPFIFAGYGFGDVKKYALKINEPRELINAFE